MHHLIHEDEHTFTTHSGLKFAKTLHTMAPGGVYEACKANGPLPGTAENPVKLWEGGPAPMEFGQPPAPDTSFVPEAPPMVGGAPPPDPSLTQAPVEAAPQIPTFQAPPPPPPQPAPQPVAVQTQPQQNAPSGGSLPDIPLPKQATQAGQGGGLGTSRETLTTHTGLDKENAALYKNAAGEQENAIHANAEAERGGLQDEAALQGKQAQDSNNEAAELRANQQKMRDTFDKFDANLTKGMDEYAKMNIKPKTIFQDGNTGQNITAGLAIMLGALGGAAQGTGGNSGLDIMNKAIDRDLEAQKANLEKKGHQINMLGMQYKAAREAGMDDQEATAMVHAKSKDAILAQIKQVQANTKSAQVLNNANIAISVVEKKQAEDLGKLSTTIKTDTIKPNYKFEGSKEAEKAEQKAQLLANIQQAAKDAPDSIGRWDGNMARAATAVGGQSEKTTKLNSAISEYRLWLKKNEDTFRNSPTMEKDLDAVVPNQTDAPDNFNSKLNAQISLNEMEHQNAYKNAGPGIRRPTLPTAPKNTHGFKGNK